MLIIAAAIQYESYYHTMDKSSAPVAHAHSAPPTMKNRPLPSEPIEQHAPPIFPPAIGML